MTSYLRYPKALTAPLKAFITTGRMSSVNTSRSVAGTRTILIFPMLIAMSTRNAGNRGQMKYISRQRSKSTIASKYDMGNPEMGEMQSIVENYRQRYMDPSAPPHIDEKLIAPPHIDEKLIADEVLGVRKGYKRGVGPKLKGAASTSSTTASLSRDPPVPDSELRDFFN
ncbi:hypothetical protein PanWU01x14_241100 [Parasponia andersonii]|uniref:Uncharacterized protein n=1 Tax=Parasponia andersonii TaxID=3476 RepID=A0A2P5BGN7_PARAD|nr:hypothetical protein PanWU01x14_241100 [Parasponia andersonii]